MLCKEEPRHTTASLTDGHQLQSSPAQLQQLRTSWEIDGIGIALSPHIERKYWKHSINTQYPYTSQYLSMRDVKRKKNKVVIEEVKYFFAHYITVTNSEHACAAFPIIDYKQLQ